jgi:ABC-type Fe3+/spermidine/putrescine transport system ATPase subunit
VRGRENGALVVEAFGQPLKLAAQEAHPAGAAVTLIVRPEMIQVRKDTGTYQGIVRRAAYLGDAIDYDVEVAGQLLTASETNPLQMEVYPEGASVGVSFYEACVHVLRSA